VDKFQCKSSTYNIKEILYFGVALFRVNWRTDGMRYPLFTQLLRERFLRTNQSITEREARFCNKRSSTILHNCRWQLKTELQTDLVLLLSLGSAEFRLIHCSLPGLIVPRFWFPRSSPEALHVRRCERPLSAKGWKGEKWPIKFSLTNATSTSL
jgi:hypothetical protein